MFQSCLIFSYIFKSLIVKIPCSFKSYFNINRTSDTLLSLSHSSLPFFTSGSWTFQFQYYFWLVARCIVHTCAGCSYTMSWVHIIGPKWQRWSWQYVTVLHHWSANQQMKLRSASEWHVSWSHRCAPGKCSIERVPNSHSLSANLHWMNCLCLSIVTQVLLLFAHLLSLWEFVFIIYNKYMYPIQIDDFIFCTILLL